MLLALIFIDNADLHIFNLELDNIEEVMVKVQKLLDTSHRILQFIEVIYKFLHTLNSVGLLVEIRLLQIISIMEHYLLINIDG